MIFSNREDDWFSNLWSLTHGRGLFFPEYVAAAVPSDTSPCVITSFGLRLRGTTRWFNLFPQLLRVSCSASKG